MHLEPVELVLRSNEPPPSLPPPPGRDCHRSRRQRSLGSFVTVDFVKGLFRHCQALNYTKAMGAIASVAPGLGLDGAPSKAFPMEVPFVK